jgi:rhodanese-related sulfurtransferase
MVNISRVSPAEAKRLIDEEGYTYLDVRTAAEYAAGHPDGAHNVPVMNPGPQGMAPNADFLEIVEALYPKDAKLVLGCRSGGRSLRAAEMLVAAGYTKIIDQRAGYEGARDAFGAVTETGWSPAGLPTVQETLGGSYAELRKKAGKA